MNQKVLILAGFIVGVSATGIGFFTMGSFPSFEDEFDSDMETKIENINRANQEQIDPDKYPVAEGCEIDDEIKIITTRLNCSRLQQKASRSWTDLQAAETQVLQMIKDKNVQDLLSFTSCDATDLTWYELHCEADRMFVDKFAYQAFFKHLKSLGPIFLKNARWQRVHSHEKKVRNPNWIVRSRLRSTSLKLEDPWKNEKHPVENETIILLEQRLDGRIYISGLPVTGIPGSEEHQVAEK